MNLPEFSVRNSIFGNMLTIAVFAAGITAALLMPRELFPRTEMGLVVVSTFYRNASAAEIENQVTSPLEEEIRGIDGIDEFTSTSAENVSVIAITLDPDTDNEDRVINDISRKIDRANLPDGAERPDVEVIATRDDVLHVTISGDVSEPRLREYAKALKAQLEAVKGVASVIKNGWRDPEIWVEVDPEKLTEYELPIDMVIHSLAAQNINQPGGTIREGTKDILLRTVGQFESLDDILAVVVRSNADGGHLTVRDIATVKDAYSDDSVVLRANGSRGITLDVVKKTKADAIRVADRAQSVVELARAQLPEGIELGIIDFESYVIKRRLKVLLGNGAMGLLLVLCTLPLVLNLRLAIVTALGIPFAFLTTILIMTATGITINMITMFGIILVVGMLVDDAIIVSENVFRHIEMGKSPHDAAIQGATEVMWPVTATILTTIVAFAPMLFLPGMIGKILKWIPTVVIITLAASLFEALIILPCHISEFVRAPKKKREDKKSARISAALSHGYGQLIDLVLSHRALFVVLVITVFIGSIGVAKKTMRMELFPADLIEIFTVDLTMPSGTARDVTEACVDEVEEVIQRNLGENELGNILTFVGTLTDSHGANFTAGSRYSTLFVYLTPTQDRDRSAQDIVVDLRERCEAIEGKESLRFAMLQGGPPVGKAVDIKVVGEDYEVLDKIAAEMKPFLAACEGMKDVKDDYEPGKDELRMTVNRAEAARLGVNVESVARTIFAAFEGAPATVVRDAEEETNIRVKLAQSSTSSEETLMNLAVMNRAGRLVELRKLVTSERHKSISQMFHFDGQRAISVTAAVEGGSKNQGAAIKANKETWEEFKNIHEKYPGYRITRTGEWEETESTKLAMMKAAGAALLMIYTILVIQFRSFAQPLVVLTSIPFGLTGVLLALAAHGKPISMMAMMGMVGMCGVVVNDAIVLVSFINDLRRDGVPAHEAIRQASVTRFRPIVLTSVTTVLGMAPVIYGIGGYEPFVAPAAIVLAYGLLFATVLTLLVVPCLYSLGVDLGSKVKGQKSEVRGQ